MNPAFIMAALVMGLALGAMYFGGLWSTVRNVPTMRLPALWLAVSFAVRMGMLLAGAYLVMEGRWERLAAYLIGILLARTLLVHRLGNIGQAFGPSGG